MPCRQFRFLGCHLNLRCVDSYVVHCVDSYLFPNVISTYDMTRITVSFAIITYGVSRGTLTIAIITYNILTVAFFAIAVITYAVSTATFSIASIPCDASTILFSDRHYNVWRVETRQLCFSIVVITYGVSAATSSIIVIKLWIASSAVEWFLGITKHIEKNTNCNTKR